MLQQSSQRNRIFTIRLDFYFFLIILYLHLYIDLGAAFYIGFHDGDAANRNLHRDTRIADAGRAEMMDAFQLTSELIE